MGRPRLPKPPPPPPVAEPRPAAGPSDLPGDPDSPDHANHGVRPPTGVPLETVHQPVPGSRVLQGESDEELAGRASRGDDKAFEVLVDRYQKVVFNLTLRMTGSWQDARELTQEVFVRTWRGLHGFDTRLRFFSWIYRIAIHACLNLRRRNARREPLDREPESGDRGPDRQAEAHELERKVHEALGRLSDGDRQLLVLRHFLERSHEEIAEALGVPAMRVKSRLFTARQRLRRELEQRGIGP